MLSQTLRNSQSWTGVIRVDVADSSSGQSNGLVWSTSHRTYPREGAPPMDGQYRPMHQVTIQVQRLVHQRRRAPMSASAKHCPSFSTSQQSLARTPMPTSSYLALYAVLAVSSSPLAPPQVSSRRFTLSQPVCS